MECRDENPYPKVWRAIKNDFEGKWREGITAKRVGRFQNSLLRIDDRANDLKNLPLKCKSTSDRRLRQGNREVHLLHFDIRIDVETAAAVDVDATAAVDVMQWILIDQLEFDQITLINSLGWHPRRRRDRRCYGRCSTPLLSLHWIRILLISLTRHRL